MHALLHALVHAGAQERSRLFRQTLPDTLPLIIGHAELCFFGHVARQRGLELEELIVVVVVRPHLHLIGVVLGAKRSKAPHAPRRPCLPLATRCPLDELEREHEILAATVRRVPDWPFGESVGVFTAGEGHTRGWGHTRRE